METRTRINPLPAELEKGDVVRDCGIERTVLRTAASAHRADLVIVYFEPVATPEGCKPYPEHLDIPATQRVTAWRP